MHGSSTFPKAERLRHGHQFRRVYEQGRRIPGRLAVLYVVEAAASPSPGAARMIGVITGRAIGGAVERNRARRLMREAFRLNRQKLKDNFQMIVVARTAIRGAGFTEVQAELLRLLRAAGMMMDS